MAVHTMTSKSLFFFRRSDLGCPQIKSAHILTALHSHVKRIFSLFFLGYDCGCPHTNPAQLPIAVHCNTLKYLLFFLSYESSCPHIKAAHTPLTMYSNTLQILFCYPQLWKQLPTHQSCPSTDIAMYSNTLQITFLVLRTENGCPHIKTAHIPIAMYSNT